MGSAFNNLMQGLNEVESFLQGERAGFKVHTPASINVKQFHTRSADITKEPEASQGALGPVRKRVTRRSRKDSHAKCAK